MKQEIQLSSETDAQNIKQKIKRQKQQKHQATLENIRSYLTEEQIRLNNLNQEHGSSSWLTTLPLSEEGYDLTKQLFWDLIRICYGHSQDFQHIVSAVKNPTYSMLCLPRKVASYHYHITS